MRRKLMLPALAACALLAVSAPVASAAKTPRAHAAVSGKSFNKLAKKVGNAIAKINSLKNADKGAAGAIHGVDGRVDTVVANLAAVKATVDAIVANVPAITSALTALKDGLTIAGANLTKLGGVVDSSIAAKPTIVVAQIFAGTPVAANALKGCFVATPHLPFSGNSTSATVTCPVVQVTGDPAGGPQTAPAAGGNLTVMASCRTLKTNVDLANGKPCAVAGIAGLTAQAVGGAPTGILTSKANAALGGAPLYPLDANKLFSKDASQGTYPLSLSTGGTDTVDNPTKLVNLTDTASNASVVGAQPALANCGGGSCASIVTITLRAVDSNPQVPS